jgi:hypothetical protein
MLAAYSLLREPKAQLGFCYITPVGCVLSVLHAISQKTFSHLARTGMLYIAPNVYLGLVRAHISPENQHKQPQESH